MKGLDNAAVNHYHQRCLRPLRGRFHLLIIYPPVAPGGIYIKALRASVLTRICVQTVAPPERKQEHYFRICCPGIKIIAKAATGHHCFISFSAAFCLDQLFNLTNWTNAVLLMLWVCLRNCKLFPRQEKNVARNCFCSSHQDELRVEHG